MKDGECRQAFSKHKAEQVALMFWLIMVFSWLDFFFNLGATFLVTGYNPLHVITCAFVQLLMLFALFFKLKNRLENF
jgi:hypothetical protein